MLKAPFVAKKISASRERAPSITLLDTPPQDQRGSPPTKTSLILSSDKASVTVFDSSAGPSPFLDPNDYEKLQKRVQK